MASSIPSDSSDSSNSSSTSLTSASSLTSDVSVSSGTLVDSNGDNDSVYNEPGILGRLTAYQHGGNYTDSNRLSQRSSISLLNSNNDDKYITNPLEESLMADAEDAKEFLLSIPDLTVEQKEWVQTLYDEINAALITDAQRKLVTLQIQGRPIAEQEEIRQNMQTELINQIWQRLEERYPASV